MARIFIYDGREFPEACEKLPLPQVQQPSLLQPEPRPRHNCALAVENEEQSRVINQAMAALVLQFVDRLITGKLSWMGAYLDLESGCLNTVPAEPLAVSRVTGLSEKWLTYRPRPQKIQEQIRVRV